METNLRMRGVVVDHQHHLFQLKNRFTFHPMIGLRVRLSMNAFKSTVRAHVFVIDRRARAANVVAHFRTQRRRAGQHAKVHVCKDEGSVGDSLEPSEFHPGLRFKP